jgi:hypothetical protein
VKCVDGVAALPQSRGRNRRGLVVVNGFNPPSAVKGTECTWTRGGISGRGVVHVPHILGVQRLHGSFSIECQTAFDWMPWEYVPPTRASVFASRTSHA